MNADRLLELCADLDQVIDEANRLKMAIMEEAQALRHQLEADLAELAERRAAGPPHAEGG